jgi:thioredoxin reductase
MPTHDAIIIGGGPAGLSAALMLGRCRRSVLILDANEPRNLVSRGLHGYLTRDGIEPGELRAKGWADVARYPGIKRRETPVTEVHRENGGGGFRILTQEGAVEHAHLLLLATGRTDPLPELPGFEKYFGRGVYHCPYCDGWEHRGKPMAVYGSCQGAVDLAFELLTWSEQVTLCSDGAPRWESPADSLSRAGIRVITDPVRGLEGSSGSLRRICFATSAEALECDALFFSTECMQRSVLPEKLGCRFDAEDSVLCDNHRAVGIPGLFVAGNVRGGVHLAITAAAEGAEAGIAMNEALLERSLRSKGCQWPEQ